MELLAFTKSFAAAAVVAATAASTVVPRELSAAVAAIRAQTVFAVGRVSLVVLFEWPPTATSVVAEELATATRL